MSYFMFMSQFSPGSYGKIHKNVFKFGDDPNYRTPEQSDFSLFIRYIIQIPEIQSVKYYQ